MPTIERSVEIAASPETVWSVVADPNFLPKLYPDILTATPNQPGLVQVGTKLEITGRMAGRKVQAATEVVEAESNSKLVVKQVPGGFLKKYFSTQTLEPTKRGTRVTTKVEYDAAAGYLGKALSVLVANRTIRNNIIKSLANLKEISELKNPPSSSS